MDEAIKNTLARWEAAKGSHKTRYAFLTPPEEVPGDHERLIPHLDELSRGFLAFQQNLSVGASLALTRDPLEGIRSELAYATSHRFILRILLADPSEWIRACAAHALTLHFKEFTPDELVLMPTRRLMPDALDAVCQELGVSSEVVSSLAKSWLGTLPDLVEAARLVER